MPRLKDESDFSQQGGVHAAESTKPKRGGRKREASWVSVLEQGDWRPGMEPAREAGLDFGLPFFLAPINLRTKANLGL